MSVCIEQCNYPSNHNNFSQHLPAADKVIKTQGTSQPQKSLVERVKIWFEVSRQRKQLAQLDERLLQDIGYTKAQARAEYTKSFWK